MLAILIQKPQVYPAVRRWISVQDFEEEQDETTQAAENNWCQTVANYIFPALQAGTAPQMADVISCFDLPERQEQVLALAQLEIPEEKQALEKLVTETVKSLKMQSLERSIRSSTDMETLQEAIEQKKALQHLTLTL